MTRRRKKRERRVPLTSREDLIAWLQRKAEAGGFRVNADSLRTIPRGREFFHKEGRSHGTHTAVEFQGELTVTDPAQFRATVAAGIGSAKAFGFGLLVLAPDFNRRLTVRIRHEDRSRTSKACHGAAALAQGTIPASKPRRPVPLAFVQTGGE